VRGIERLRRKLRRRPLRFVESYRAIVVEQLGAEDGRPWTYLDYGKRCVPWGKLHDLKKVFAMLARIVTLLDQGEVDRAHGATAQTLKALEQVAISQGSWRAAWPLVGMTDPFSRRPFAGDAEEVEAVAAYITELDALETKIKSRGGPKVSSGSESPGAAGQGTPGAAADGKKKKKKKWKGKSGQRPDAAPQ